MRCDEIGVGISKDEFVSFLNSVKGGQFFFIRKYRNKDNEVANHFLRFGISYANLKARDIRFVNSVLAGEKPVEVKVTHGVWIEADRIQSIFLSAEAIAALSDEDRKELVNMTIRHEGAVGGATVAVDRQGTVNPMDVTVFSNRKSKGRIPATLSYVLPSTHPLVVAALGAEDSEGTVLQGLARPRPVEQGYEQEGKSVYSKDDEGGVICWYLRDILRVSKVVLDSGNYPFKASLPINAIKDSFRSQYLLSSRYGEFKLKQGCFESVSIEGQVVMLGEDSEESVYLALPEAVKEAVATETIA